jgi:hypothetical protein
MKPSPWSHAESSGVVCSVYDSTAIRVDTGS